MDPTYYFAQCLSSTIITPQILQQPMNFDAFSHQSRLPIQNLDPQAFFESKLLDASLIRPSIPKNNFLIQPQVVDSNSFVSPCSKPTILLSQPYQTIRESDFFDSSSLYEHYLPPSSEGISEKPSYMVPVPMVTITLPPSLSIDSSKLSAICQSKEKLTDKLLNNPGHQPYPMMPKKTPVHFNSPSTKSCEDEFINPIINQMNTNLRLGPSQGPNSALEHQKLNRFRDGAICDKHRNSARKQDQTSTQVKPFPQESAKTENGGRNSLITMKCETKSSGLISDESSPETSSGFPSLVESKTVCSTSKTLSWAAVAVSLPKPKQISPTRQVAKPSDTFPISPVTNKPSVNTDGRGRCQNRHRHLENKSRVSSSLQVETSTTFKKVEKHQRKRKNLKACVRITPEQRERLLTRYRSRLEEQITHRTSPRILLSEVQKRKRRSRLKAGIIRDRIARRAFHLLLQEKQERKPGSDGEQCGQVNITTATEIIPPKIVKIVLPTLPALEQPIKEMLGRLAGFQDRAFKQTENAPAKRKNTRRIVCGFHEVIKSLKLKKLKFLIVANDLEKGAYEIEVESAEIKGDERSHENQPPKRSNALPVTLKQAVDMAHEQGCPVVMAFKRRYLQKICHKGAPVSCVGVINVAGAEDIAKKLKEEYQQKVDEFTGCNKKANEVLK